MLGLIALTLLGTGCRGMDRRNADPAAATKAQSEGGEPDSALPRSVRWLLWMALPRLTVSGGARRLIFLLYLVLLFFLGVLLFHPLISPSPHFFEVVGFRITRSDHTPEPALPERGVATAHKGSGTRLTATR
jgi:hypothetical protein